MGSRSELHDLLAQLASNVYFQPPESIHMDYPCIMYKRDDISISHADNKPYKNKIRYQVTVVDMNPDSDIPGKVAALPTCSYDRSYTTDNLNHDVFNLYF